MKMMYYLTIKNLKLNKKRTLSTIVGILLTSVLLFSIGFAASTIKQNNINEALLNSGDYHVVFYDLPYQNLKKLEENKAIQDLKITQVIDNIYCDELYYGKNVNLKIENITFPYENYINIVNGKHPENNQEILISSEFAGRGNLNIGDKLNNYTIVGIYDNSKLNSEYAVINNDLIYTPYAYTTSDIDIENNLTSFYLTYKSPRNAYKKIYDTALSIGLNYELKNNLKNYENTKVNTLLLVAHGQYQNPADGMRIYFFFTILISDLSIFSYFAIYNSFEISLSERKKQIGTLRSIGASKKQIFKSIMFEILILLLISIPLGFIFSVTLVEVIIKLINHFLANIITIPFNFYFDIPFILISLIFIILTVFISAIMPAKRASNISIMDIIRKKEDYYIKKSKENYPLIKKIFGSEGEVAYKSIKRNSSKFNLAIISLSLSFILFITVSTFINYLLKNELNNSNFDISIILMENTKEENEMIMSEITQFKNVSDLIISKKAYLYFKDNELLTDDFKKFNDNNDVYSISLVALDEKNFKEYQRFLNTTNNIILYNTKTFSEFANVYYYEVFNKSNISLDICEINRENSYTMLDVCYLSLNNILVTNQNYLEYFNTLTLVVDIDYYNQLVDEYLKYYDNNYYNENISYQDYLENTHFLNINSKHFKKFDKEMTELINNNPGINIQYTNYALEEYDVYLVYLIVKIALYSIILFIVIISITSVFNTINTSMELRKVEFASLRSIGLSKKGLNKMIYLESFFLGIKSILYGLPISLGNIAAITWISKITRPITDPKFPFPTNYIIIGIIGICVINILIMKYSLHKIKKQNIIDAIRQDVI